MTKSILDDIPGIGPARKKQIQLAYPSMKKMKAASLEDFEQIIPEKIAQILYRRLHEEDIDALMDETEFEQEVDLDEQLEDTN